MAGGNSCRGWLSAGEGVAVPLPDAAAVHAALVALEKAGLVTVGVGARAGDRELRHLLGRTNAGGFISHAVHRGRIVADQMDALRAGAAGLRHHIVLAETGSDIGIDGEPVLGAPPDLAAAQARSHELWVVTTSGTTGLPNCVMHLRTR